MSLRSPQYDSGDEDVTRAKRRKVTTQRIVCSDDEEEGEVVQDQVVEGDEPIRVEIADTHLLILALQEVSQKSDNVVTLRITNRVKHANDCSIPSFCIKDNGTPEAQSIMGLAEELKQEVTGIVIATQSDSGLVTMTIEAQTVTGLAVGEYRDVVIMTNKLLSILSSNKGKAINITLYPGSDKINVLLYSLSECHNFTETIIPMCDSDDDGAADKDRISQMLMFEFSQNIFINVSDLVTVIKDKEATSKTRITLHQITDRDRNASTRIVSVEVFSDDASGCSHRKNWIVNSNATEKATSCVGTGTDAAQNEPTQVVIRKHEKMMQRVAQLEDLSRRLVRPASQGETALLDRAIHYKISHDGNPIPVDLVADAKYTYQSAIHATFNTKALLNILMPLETSKRRIGLMFPPVADHYMLIVAPLGGLSRLLYFTMCLKQIDDD